MGEKEYRIVTGESRLFGRIYRIELAWEGDDDEEGDVVASIGVRMGRVFVTIDVDLVSALSEVFGERWCSVLRDALHDLVIELRSREDRHVATLAEKMLETSFSYLCNNQTVET